MLNNRRNGTWEFYFPETSKWLKQDYSKGEKIGDFYDKCDDMEDGFQKTTRPDGSIEEASYIDGNL